MKHFRKFKLLALVILPVIMWLFYNAAANRHVHTLKNGMHTSHAHPYSKPQPLDQEDSGHKHTFKEFMVLAYLDSSMLALLLILFITGIILNPVKISFRIESVHHLIQNHQTTLHLRGPPWV